jgi:hypothetical protein
MPRLEAKLTMKNAELHLLHEDNRIANKKKIGNSSKINKEVVTNI